VYQVGAFRLIYESLSQQTIPLKSQPLRKGKKGRYMCAALMREEIHIISFTCDLLLKFNQWKSSLTLQDFWFLLWKFMHYKPAMLGSSLKVFSAFLLPDYSVFTIYHIAISFETVTTADEIVNIEMGCEINQYVKGNLFFILLLCSFFVSFMLQL
jgi:hypothetical protein